MHRTQFFADRYCKTEDFRGLLQTPLNDRQADGLRSSLRSDAADFVYSGILSIADAVQALDRNLFTWATVKLYYAVFYLTRSMLALSNVAILYVKGAPISWKCIPGTCPRKGKGNTHAFVLSEFRKEFPDHVLLSQKIGASPPLDWLIELREQANYLEPRFTEPEPSEQFRFVAQTGVRRALSAYVKDEEYLLTFLPEHAMLAYPIATLRETLQAFRAANLVLSEDDIRYLATIFFDRSGRLADAAALLRR